MSNNLSKLLISFAIVVRNEEKYVSECLESMLNQTLDPDLYEVIVVDGMSTDSTPLIIKEIVEKYHGRSIRVFENPKKILSSGWNIAIRESRGKYVIRPDAHGKVPEYFLEKNLAVMNQHPDSWAVGGILETIGKGFWGGIIAQCLSSKMGVGSSSFRVGGKPGPADTVVFGLYQRDKLLEAGGFDESIPLNQDNLCHSKIHKKGGILYFDPSIRSTYFCRDSLYSLWRQMYKRSFWLMRMLKHTDTKYLSIRYLVPSGFLLVVLFLFCAGFYDSLAWQGLAGILILYTIAGWFFASKMKLHLLKKAVVPLVFFTIHIAYGLGSILGVFSLIWYKPLKQK